MPIPSVTLQHKAPPSEVDSYATNDTSLRRRRSAGSTSGEDVSFSHRRSCEALLQNDQAFGSDSFTWRHANHSSNFLVGTATELIHVPVTPRKNMYNPVCALRLVNAARFETNLVGNPGGCEPEPPTVYLPCFCQGAISQQRTDLWQLVGRNRFSKAGARHPVKPSASSGVAVQCG